jgi:spermidine/putrescine-binding protein
MAARTASNPDRFLEGVPFDEADSDLAAEYSAMSRSGFLRRVGAASVAFGLLPTIAASPALAGRLGASALGRIDYFSWQGYDLKGVKTMDAWVKRTGLVVKSGYISSNPDIISKLRNPGGVRYDLTTAFHGLMPTMRQLNLLEPLDISKIPNSTSLLAPFRSGTFANAFWAPAGSWYGVPFTWGQATMNVTSDVSPPRTWRELLRPEWKGKVGWAGGPDGAIFLACRILRFDPAKLNQSRFDQVFAFLRRMRDQCAAFGVTFGNLAELMASGDVKVSFNGWSFVNILAAGKGAVVRNIIPAEGSYSFVDSYALPRGTDNVDAAHAFINQAVSSPVQIELAGFLAQGVTNRAAVGNLTPAQRRAYPYRSIGKVLASRAPLYALPPLRSKGGIVGYDKWLSEWAKLKAGK